MRVEMVTSWVGKQHPGQKSYTLGEKAALQEGQKGST